MLQLLWQHVADTMSGCPSICREWRNISFTITGVLLFSFFTQPFTWQVIPRNKVTTSIRCHSFSSLLEDLHGIIFIMISGDYVQTYTVLNAETSHHFLFIHGFTQRYVEKIMYVQKEKFAHRGRDFYCVSTFFFLIEYFFSTFNATSFKSSKD